MKEFEFMTKEKANEILEIALSTGGDFAEVFMENGTSEAFEMTLGKVSQVNYRNVAGAAIRIIKGDTEVNASITDSSIENLKSFADIDPKDIGIYERKGIRFKQLSLNQYLIVYQKSLEDEYRVNVFKKKEQDEEKISFIKSKM